MRQFFSFWWQCAKVASKGNSAFANDWQWLIGYPATAVLLWILAYFYAELSGRIEVTLATGALGLFVAALVAYLLTWVASFMGRFLNAPVLLYQGGKETVKPIRLREIEAQENHAEQLRRHTDALEQERQSSTPVQLALKRAFEPKPTAHSSPRGLPESAGVIAYDRDVSLYEGKRFDDALKDLGLTSFGIARA